MASCLLLFYFTSLYAVYGGTDGGANEEATGQFTLRATCSKNIPTFADKFIINQNLRLVTNKNPPTSQFHFMVEVATATMGVYFESPDKQPG